MCGRYLLDTEIREIIRTYKIQRNEIREYKAGDVYPSANAPIIFDNGQRTITEAKWGFPFGFKRGIVINARSESITTKPMFKQSFHTARCIIPANHFYEWKEEGKENKIKHAIGLQDQGLISLGGIFKMSLDENNSVQQMTFVIITTEAKGKIKDIHSRIPLIIKDNDLEAWLDKSASVKHIGSILKSSIDQGFTIKRFENMHTKSSDGDGYQQMKMF